MFPTFVIRAHTTKPGVLINEAILNDMFTAAYHLVVAATQNAKNDRKEKWFGINGVRKSTEIDGRSRKIKDYMTSSQIKQFTFSCSNNDDIASYAQYQKEKVDGGLPPDQLKKDPTIVFGSGFRSNTYSWGEKVCSLLHEITHMTIGTTDIEYSGVEMYGADRCEDLAIERANDAYRNADNWAYYFASYRGDISESGRDWKYMTAKEVASRRLKREHSLRKG